MSNEELIFLIQSGIEPQTNLEKIYLQNLPLLKAICKPYSHMEDMQDLLQVCFLGIMQAVPRYDGAKGKFSTYMTVWAKQAIRRHLSECGLIHIPPYMASLIIKYNRFLTSHETDHVGAQPTDEEVCHALMINEKQFADLKKYLLFDRLESLDHPLDAESDDNTLLDRIECPDDMTDGVINDIYKQELTAAVHEAMQTLTKQEQDALTAYYWRRATLDSISAQNGITRERVRQQIHAAQRKLMRGKSWKILKEFARVESLRYVGGFSFFKRHGSIVEFEILRKDEILEEARAKYERMKQWEQKRHKERTAKVI